ncbi:hypothetical protein P154DRAFT_333566 [Amniculicola lignicola CBS 123094]|uniref:F-box domain-containing protein n=1 Tax=Amniculicola lignicola CBS 123094 TaxID=1392246 RepID=A0A6A5W4I3_9PLEO|nr:hypothetical protein P154DRAFT_333566 [Amniculicola lignicola CBS 123094]
MRRDWLRTGRKVEGGEEEAPKKRWEVHRAPIDQKKSTFLTKLPAELRNEIYRLVFSGPAVGDLEGETPPVKKTPVHPLSLLLACRQINTEATLLAFRTHTFNVTATPSYHTLQQSVRYLSPSQVQAITSISTFQCARSCDFITNTLLLFPTITKVQIGMKRENKLHLSIHSNEGLGYIYGQDFKADAVHKYVPHWFSKALRDMTTGRGFAWQKGQKWTVEWPMMESSACYLMMEQRQGQGVIAVPTMDHVDGLALPGVEMCPCKYCGELTWLHATLLQETGRKVQVEAMYYGVVEEDTKINMKLVEGSERLPVVKVMAGTGMQWDADEEYWEGLRKRNALEWKKFMKSWVGWDAGKKSG